MGIYDRDYARGSSRPGGGGGLPLALRGLTVVHWLIIINIGVFVLDALVTPAQWPIVHMGYEFVESYDPASGDWTTPPKPDQLPSTSYQFALPIVDRGTGAVVGRSLYEAMPPLKAIGHFSTAKGFFGLEVWRFITFQFLHANLSHLIFNLIGLFVLGPIVEEALRSPRRFLAFYLLSGVSGALLYLILNLAGWGFGIGVPGVLFTSPYTPLIGASAGVFGVLFACAVVARNETILFMLLIPMKTPILAYGLFALALINLLVGGGNAGGDAAHVGGALAGAYFIRKPELLHEFFDVVKKRTPTPRRGGRGGRPGKTRGVSEKKLDEILQKVHEHGIHSLTESEKKLLNRASEDRRGP